MMAFAASSTKITVGVTAPRDTRASLILSSFKVRLIPQPTTAISISVRGISLKYASPLLGLWAGKFIADTTSPLLRVVFPGLCGIFSIQISRLPEEFTTVAVAPAAIRAGTESAAGEPLHKFPTSVALP